MIRIGSVEDMLLETRTESSSEWHSEASWPSVPRPRGSVESGTRR